jgi:hypothetical protein
MQQESFAVENFVRVGDNRHVFNVSIAIEAQDRLVIRACALVRNYTGSYSVFGPSRYNGELTELVVLPGWLRSSVHGAALRELALQPTAEAAL